MTTATAQELQEFKLNVKTVEPGDRFHLDHEGGQVVIVVTDILGMGLHTSPSVAGLATDAQAGWFGHWGRIIFYEPIRLGVRTQATFNQTSRTSQLVVIPTKLVRVRGGKWETLLG